MLSVRRMTTIQRTMCFYIRTYISPFSKICLKALSGTVMSKAPFVRIDRFPIQEGVLVEENDPTLNESTIQLVEIQCMDS